MLILDENGQAHYAFPRQSHVFLYRRKLWLWIHNAPRSHEGTSSEWASDCLIAMDSWTTRWTGLGPSRSITCSPRRIMSYCTRLYPSVRIIIIFAWMATSVYAIRFLAITKLDLSCTYAFTPFNTDEKWISRLQSRTTRKRRRWRSEISHWPLSISSWACHQIVATTPL